MEALAQEAGTAQEAIGVGVRLADRMPEVAAIVLVIGVALWFLPKFIRGMKDAFAADRQDNDRIGRLLDRAEKIGNSPPGLNVDFGRIEAMFETVGAKLDGLGDQLGSVKDDLTELRGDFKHHVEQDREVFRELYERTEPKPREPWADDDHRRKRAAAGEWKTGRKPA